LYSSPSTVRHEMQNRSNRAFIPAASSSEYVPPDEEDAEELNSEIRAFSTLDVW